MKYGFACSTRDKCRYKPVAVNASGKKKQQQQLVISACAEMLEVPFWKIYFICWIILDLGFFIF